MSARAKIIEKLYRKGKISADGVKKALDDGVITEEEYRQIISILR